MSDAKTETKTAKAKTKADLIADLPHDMDPYKKKRIAKGRRRFSDYDASDEVGSPTRVSKIFTRVIIISLSVFLIWLTSLSLATSIASLYFPAPTVEQIRTVWDLTVNVTTDESSAYTRCAKREVKRCNNNLNTSIARLEPENRQVRAQNEIVVTNDEKNAQLCVASFGQITKAVKKWQDSSSGNQLGYRGPPYSTGPCTAEEVNTVKLLFNGGYQELQSNAYILNQDYAAAVDDVVTESYYSVLNFSDYNDNYILNKTRDLTEAMPNILDGLFDIQIPIITQMLRLLSPLTDFVNCVFYTDRPCKMGSVLTAYKTMEDAYIATYNTIYRTGSTYFLQIKQWANTAWDNLLKVREFVNFIQSVYNAITQLPSPPGGWPSIPNILEPLAPLSLFNFPSIDTSIFNGVTNFFKNQVNSITNYFQSQIDNAINTIQQKFNSWKNAVRNIFSVKLPRPFQDYNPPPIKILTNLKATFAPLKTNFLQRTAASLNQFTSFKSDSSSDSSVTSVNTSSVDTSATSWIDLRSYTNFKLKSFGGNIRYYPMFQTIDGSLLLCILIDYVFRFYQSFKQVIDGVKGTSVNLPVLDVRIFESNKQTPPSVMLAKMATSNVVLYGLVTLVLAFGLLPASSAYYPLYQDYQTGCVSGTGGTLITRNLQSFVYNYASTSGNAEITYGLAEYDRSRINECSKMTKESGRDQADHEARYAAAFATHDTASKNMILINKCVDFANLPQPDAFFALYGETHPSVTIGTATQCYQSIGERPTDGTFNCSGLPKCSVACTGPSEAVLAYASYETGCRTEWLVHSFILRGFLSVLIFICINISRVQLIGALSRMHWRAMTTNGMTFTASCTRTGKTPTSMKAKLKKEVQRAVKTIERSAFFMFGVAIAIHLPYLVVMAILEPPQLKSVTS